MCTLQCNTTADQAVDGDIEILSLQYRRAQTWRFVAEKLCVCNDDAVKKKNKQKHWWNIARQHRCWRLSRREHNQARRQQWLVSASRVGVIVRNWISVDWQRRRDFISGFSVWRVMNQQLLEYGTCRPGRRDVVIVSATLAVCHWQATARRSTDQSLIDLQTN